MPFHRMPEVVHKAASRKGGRVKVKKGFGSNPELARLAGSKGGINASQSRKGAKQTQEGGSISSPSLADIFGDIDEKIQE